MLWAANVAGRKRYRVDRFSEGSPPSQLVWIELSLQAAREGRDNLKRAPARHVGRGAGYRHASVGNGVMKLLQHQADR